MSSGHLPHWAGNVGFTQRLDPRTSAAFSGSGCGNGFAQQTLEDQVFDWVVPLVRVDRNVVESIQDQALGGWVPFSPAQAVHQGLKGVEQLLQMFVVEA